MLGRIVYVLLVGIAACSPEPSPWDVNGDGHVVVACLGDSNTDSRWPEPYTAKWCEFAAERLPGWRFTNHAVSGATVTPRGESQSWAGPQLDAALVDGAPDVVILAFGTNDVRADRSTDEIVEAYRVATRRVEMAGPLAFVALAPPIYPPEVDRAEALSALNAALRGAFPAVRLIDFSTGMIPVDFEADGLHPNATGQHKRVEATLQVLRP